MEEYDSGMLSRIELEGYSGLTEYFVEFVPFGFELKATLLYEDLK
jgi:hypothetical protein